MTLQGFVDTVVIDDTEAALSAMSELGRRIAADPTQEVAQAAVAAATRQGWATVKHSYFRDWAGSRMSGADLWLSLDPLLPGGTFANVPVATLRLTRVAAGNVLTHEREEVESVVDAHWQGATVGVVDDSVFSGSTFRRAAHIIQAAGGRLCAYIVCTSTAPGRAAAEALCPGAGWSQFISGDHPAMHLRDSCPFLPYSGRRRKGHDRIMTARGPVRMVYAPMTFFGSPWSLLRHDRSLVAAIARGQRAIVERLSAHLGRQARVEDALLLGTEVCVPIIPGREAANVPLAALIS